jgi:hypothetical protein
MGRKEKSATSDSECDPYGLWRPRELTSELGLAFRAETAQPSALGGRETFPLLPDYSVTEQNPTPKHIDNRSILRLGPLRTRALPYNCSIVCCTAIKWLREDSVAWLVGSRSNSAWYTLTRNSTCFLRRSIVTGSSRSATGIPYCTGRPWRKFPEVPYSVRKTDRSLATAGRGWRIGVATLELAFPQCIDLPAPSMIAHGASLP